MEVSIPQSSTDNTPLKAVDLISTFPTTGQPISVTTLKDMMLSLRESLQSDLVSSVKKCQLEAQALGERIDHMEQTMGDYSTSFYTPVDTHNAHNEQIMWLKDKIGDLQDRSRRNNIKI